MDIFKEKTIILYDKALSLSYNQFDALTLKKVFNPENKDVTIITLESSVDIKEVEKSVITQIVLQSKDMLTLLHTGSVDSALYTKDIDLKVLRKSLIESAEKIFIIIPREYITFTLRSGHRPSYIMTKDITTNRLMEDCDYDIFSSCMFKYEKVPAPKNKKYILDNGFNIYEHLTPFTDRLCFDYLTEDEEGKKEFPNLTSMTYHMYMCTNDDEIIPTNNDKFLCYLLISKYFDREVLKEDAPYHSMIQMLKTNKPLIDAFKNMTKLVKALNKFYETYSSNPQASTRVILEYNDEEIPITKCALSNFADIIHYAAFNMVIDILVQTNAIFDIFNNGAKYIFKKDTDLDIKSIVPIIKYTKLELRISVNSKE